MPGGLLWLIVVIVIAAVVLWALTQIPMDPVLYRIVRVLIIVVVAIYVIWFLISLVGGAPRHRPLTTSLTDVRDFG